jgi:hypothetical protein
MSVSSCFTGGELNIKLNKIFIISKEKVVDSTTIEDERVPATTLLIVLLSLLLIFAAVGVCQIFNAGFSTYQNFLTANGAVSNTLLRPQQPLKTAATMQISAVEWAARRLRVLCPDRR